MQHPGWALVVIGGLMVAIGLLWLLAPGVPWLGRLPGDFVIERKNFRFYFPVATCILLSLALSAVVWLIRRFSR